jgi:hypothetical protein
MPQADSRVSLHLLTCFSPSPPVTKMHVVNQHSTIPTNPSHTWHPDRITKCNHTVARRTISWQRKAHARGPGATSLAAVAIPTLDLAHAHAAAHVQASAAKSTNTSTPRCRASDSAWPALYSADSQEES